MIGDTLVKKYDLQVTDIVIGQSFYFNCVLYRIGSQPAVFMMDCDLTGKPLLNNTLMLYCNKATMEISVEMLDDLEKPTIKAIIHDFYKKAMRWNLSPN